MRFSRIQAYRGELILACEPPAAVVVVSVYRVFHGLRSIIASFKAWTPGRRESREHAGRERSVETNQMNQETSSGGEPSNFFTVKRLYLQQKLDRTPSFMHRIWFPAFLPKFTPSDRKIMAPSGSSTNTLPHLSGYCVQQRFLSPLAPGTAFSIVSGCGG